MSSAACQGHTHGSMLSGTRAGLIIWCVYKEVCVCERETGEGTEEGGGCGFNSLEDVSRFGGLRRASWCGGERRARSHGA